MKKASLILSQLGNLPQFKLLKQQECYQKFISLLGAKWQKAIAFVYVRDSTLFVVLKHPGFKMELNYNRDLLKSVLTQLGTLDKTCSGLKADKVAIFHSKYHSMLHGKPASDTVPHYHELASPEFPVLSSDQEIKARFEALKAVIKDNRQKKR